jgi:hypothetical protein
MKPGLLILSITFYLTGYSQTGPGGVGTNDGTSFLKMWYRPDFGITTTGSSIDTWLNGAGEPEHDLLSTGTNRPTLSINSLNQNDELVFDGNDYLETTGTLSTSNFVTNQASSYIVIQRNATTASWPYSTSPHQTNRFSSHISWSNGAVYYDIGTCCSSNARIQISGLSALNNYSYWSYDALSTSGKQLYRNGNLLQNRANTVAYTSHANHTFRIGENSNSNMTEIIIFRQKVNTAQRIIIENYLSAKYNITAAVNDLFNEDDPENGNYDFDVAGIGRVDLTNLHSDSRGTGIVRILNPTDLNDDEFFIWGHDNGTQQATITADVPVPVNARFERVWRVSEVNTASTAIDVGDIDIRFDLTGLGTVTASDLILLIDTDNDGIFIDETVGTGGVISGAVDLGSNIYEFSAVINISNNIRFTLGTINSNQTPLPIELINFEVKPVSQDYVNISWQTKSEINNDYFTIEKSKNNIDWKDLEFISGSGNSSSNLTYSAKDNSPFIGVSYYRLKQTDFNGQQTFSEIKRINLKSYSDNPVNIYPNPSDQKITVIGNIDQVNQITIFNVLGENLTNQVSITKTSQNEFVIDFLNLSKGIYFIKTKQSANKVYLR